MTGRDWTAVGLYMAGGASVSAAAFLNSLVVGFGVLGVVLIVAALLLGRG